MQLPPVVPHLRQRGAKPCRHLHPQERYTTLRDGQEVGHDGGCGEAQAAQGHRGGRCLRRARGRHRGAGAARRAPQRVGNGGRAGSARLAGARDRCGCSATSSVVPDGSEPSTINHYHGCHRRRLRSSSPRPRSDLVPRLLSLQQRRGPRQGVQRRRAGGRGAASYRVVAPAHRAGPLHPEAACGSLPVSPCDPLG